MCDTDCPIHNGRSPRPDDITRLPDAKECYCTTCTSQMLEVRPDRGLLPDDDTPLAERGLQVCPRCGEEWIEGRPSRRPCSACLEAL